MEERYRELLVSKCGEEGYRKIAVFKNPELYRFVGEFIQLCNPDRVFVCTDSPEDKQYIRRRAIEMQEEYPLVIPGHTVHFDGYYDQARDKKNTKFLLPEGIDLGQNIHGICRKDGLKEIYSYLKDIMVGKEAYICFFSLGPVNSEFSILAVQITDSAYVAHSEDLLYREGYEAFKELPSDVDFFKFVHSAGVLENGVSRDVEKRRIYIDLTDNIVYSVNTQYGGNTIGLKKLALRLAIQKASREGWLAEHMFIMGVNGPSGRKTYLTGAFPSACGKTSTAMLPGESIVGDDIAYIRNINGVARAVNVERGVFGIIRDVNSKDDPLVWEVLTSPGEVIFSNVLVTEDGIPYWLGKDGPVPHKGRNHSGKWYIGKLDCEEKEIPPSHKNARYTFRLTSLKNCDPLLNDPGGVEVGAFIYGGRDSDTWVPVEEAFDWVHGIITKGASLESETTAATLGEEGIRVFNLMSNLDFLSIPVGRYILNNLEFGKKLNRPPLVFSVNYFLRDKSTWEYLNAMEDKHIWIKWIELRVHRNAGALISPTGLIPVYEDIKKLFKEVLQKEYTIEDYIKQFTIRIPENLEKIDRILNIYQHIKDTPDIVFDILTLQQKRLKEFREKFGEYINPTQLSLAEPEG